MAKMTKDAFTAIINKRKEQVSGYVFNLLLLDNTIKKMGVYESKADKCWWVIDVNTGKSVCSSTTRKDAVARVESEPVLEKLTAFFSKEDKPTKVDASESAALEKRIAELEKQLASAEATAKMWQQKAEEYYESKPKPEAPAAPKPPKKQKEEAAIEEMATVVNLETLLGEMREWCESHPNTIAERRPGDKATVRIAGVQRKDTDWQEELMELGFRFAKGPKVWMYDIRSAEKAGKTIVDGR